MVDLHIHSWYSDDGEYMPEDLVKKCAAQRISMISITDHNCVKANEEAVWAARGAGIAYVAGAEFDCQLHHKNFHILGYNFDYKSKDFEFIEKNIVDQGFKASINMLEATQRMGFRITENNMWEISKKNYHQEIWTGEMFAEVLLSKTENINNPLLIPYREGGIRSDNPYVNFYWDFYSQGKACYVKINYPSVSEIIDIIHENGGIAVLAHPGANLQKEDCFFLEEIIALGIDGIEAYSSYHSKKQVNFYKQKAQKNKLLITHGSDFHGKTKPAINIGKKRTLTD